MRVPRKSAQEILGAFIPEVIEKQERVQFGRVLKTEGPVQFHTRAFHCRNGFAGL